MDGNQYQRVLFPAERIPTLLVGVATLALAIWVLTIRPHDRVHRSLFIFLLARSVFYGLIAAEDNPSTVWGSYAGYWALLVPFAALAFGRAFHLRYQEKKRGGEPRWDWIYAAMWALALGAMIWYFFDHQGTLPGTELRVLDAVMDLGYLAYAVLGYIFAHQFLKAPLGNHRQAMLLLAIGFMVDAAFRSTRILPEFIFDPPAGYVANNLFSLFIFAGIWIVLIETAVAMRMRGQRPKWRSASKRYEWTIALAAGSGLAVFALSRVAAPNVWIPVQFLVEAVWLLLLVVVVGYGIMRCRMFDIELQAKRLVRGGTVAAPFAFVFFIMGESMEGWALDTFGINGYWVGLIAAGLISLGLFPLQRLARRVAERLFPGVDGSEEYQRQRREQLYKAAVEDAVDDKIITDRERMLLNEVRAHLDLTPQQAKGLEKAVMSSVMAVLAR